MITRNFHMREGPDPGAQPTRPAPEEAEGRLRRGLRRLLRRLGRAAGAPESEGRDPM